MVTAFWVILGLSLGSFVNVLIHRLPGGKSLFLPPSHCPRYGKPVAFYDNVPVLSFLWLRGRCRRCGQPISWRYPAVEVLLGALAFGLWRRWGDPAWTTAALVAVSALVAVAFIDWDTFLIPDELSVGLLGLGVLTAAVNPAFSGSFPWRLAASLGGAAAGFAMSWAVATFGEALFKREAMGGGDIKLLAAVGAWSGALGAFDCLLLGSMVGAVYGAALLARRKVRRQDPIPFGPFLSAAAVFNFFHILPFGFPFN